MCPWGTWGWECSNECNCTDVVLDNSTTCDPVNGTCPDDGNIHFVNFSYTLPSLHSLPHTLTPSHPHSLASFLPHTLTPSHPHSLASFLPHTLTPSHPHSLTSFLPHTLTPSHPHSLTSFLPQTLTSSHPPIGIYNCNDYPCGDNTLCRDVDDTFECYCNPGYQLANETTCEGII